MDNPESFEIPLPKKIDSSELTRLLRNPSGEILKEDEGKYYIQFDNYHIEDKFIILDDTVNLQNLLIFKNCTFESENLIFVSGMICNEGLTFENCSFSNSLHFNNGNFKKEILVKYSDFKNHGIHFTFCKVEKINISSYNISEVWVSGAKFESLRIGDYLLGEHIKKLTIFGKPNEVGDVHVEEQSFDEISLHGTNKDRVFSFSKITCNNISISKFKNEGSLSFYGVRPKITGVGYFQIINSNLENAEFYRTIFSEFKELIIIDSFVTDTLFIACKWSSNIRAVFGPGYLSFEKSIKSGRKITSNEIVGIREAYRQLKISMSKHSDKIQENKFYAQELIYYNKSLGWTRPWCDSFWDKIVLFWSNFFSNYGQSFIKPLFWLLLGHFILFFIGLLLNGFDPLYITITDASWPAFEEAFEKYFIYINPLRKFEVSFSGYLIILDLIMRIWSSYMIYNIIRASRRFIS